MGEPRGSGHRLGRLARERVEPDLDPDPIFRQRLRGVVVNRHVAIREGIEPPPDAGRPQMGRLGRACLNASVALAASVSGVMAVSEQALPGDLLYPVKREIEALRFQVVPADFHDELRAAVLTERVDEIRRLADAGESAALASLAEEVGALDATATTLAPAQVGVLNGLLEQLPPPVRITVDEAIQAAAPDAPGPTQTSDGDGDDEGESDADGDQPGVTVSGSSSTPSPTPSPTPTPTPSPTLTASPTPTPTPSGTPSPTPIPTPTSDDDD